ncbi:Hydroxyacylglutathione hydrolase [Streptococcus sp. DD10]|uniref:MBL fold metallo-hydrolase n=1 Tax=Streptococcus sp. DD10 TaxID=1777878 RepID=UPI000796EA2B|nr:MBL fold metallo-hydrolase [Streptococcus sp. DD10]KXT74105.1 Hydroxyacylglutathione hydrolase [Streptococcus sp. DD10]
MNIHKIINPVAYENTYIIENDNYLLVIDPGSDFNTIQNKLITLAKPISAILLTHTHYDHIMSLEAVRRHFGHPPVYVSEPEASWLYTPVDNLSGLPRHDDMEDIIAHPAEEIFYLKQDYHIDGFHFQVLPTPGHSIGGVSFVFPDADMVLTGDALFRETIGRTDLPTGNMEQLLHSIKTQLLTLPKHYTAYPGHGPETTISHEKNFNPFL